MMRMRPHKLIVVHLMGVKIMALTSKTIGLIYKSKYIIVHENLYSLICINIGGSHFGHLFLGLSCPLFTRHYLEHRNFCTCQKSLYFEVIFKNPLRMQHPFCESTYFVSFFDGQFLKCDILPVSNDSVFLSQSVLLQSLATPLKEGLYGTVSSLLITKFSQNFLNSTLVYSPLVSVHKHFSFLPIWVVTP